jgi:dihydrolipoamide dehydrogenase
MADRFQLVVIGSGPGGYVAAIRAAQLGIKTAIVEKSRTLGGTCLNIGCIPSKALLDSSELYYLAKNRFGKHGIQVGGLTLDVPKMISRKSDVVKGLTDGVAGLMKKNGISVYPGSGKVLPGKRVQVTGDKPAELEADAILLATGSEPTALPFLPFDGQQIVSSTEALAFDKVPQHLIVIGGGYIGLELGSVWARLGARVTVLEFLPKILPFNDEETANVLFKSLQRQGLEFQMQTKVTGAVKQKDKVVVQAEQDGKKVEFTGDKVLVSVGRRPYTAGLGLAELGVKLEERSGRVLVNEKYETNVPGVYAIGDLIAGPMLAHKASEEGVAVAETLGMKAGHVNYDTIPSVIYTHPEVAAVGKTEEELKKAGTAYKVGKFPFIATGRAKAMDEVEGFVKVLTDAKTDRVLGMHIVGPRASDLIAEGVLAMEFHGTAEDIARTCHSHPTLGEAVGEAARAAWTKAIQM